MSEGSKIGWQLSFIIVVAVALTTIAVALSTPYSLSGYVYDSDGTTPIVGANITFTNQNSSEIIYTNSGTNGQYQQDAANFASGYYNADSIQYYTVNGAQNNTTTAPINVVNGGTSLNIVLCATPTPTPTPIVSSTGTATSIDRMANLLLLLFLFVLGLVFLFYSWLAPEKYNYTDIVAAFLSVLIFFIVAYYSLRVLGYGWFAMFVLIFALIQIMFMVVKLIDAFRAITDRM